ncbi:hypothetical protein B0H13DRAFT_1877085 [Mycena leptocephala]|nr:hypothetical protein B0H13DRAFT_1877085 [Mycena leptocephala]
MKVFSLLLLIPSSLLFTAVNAWQDIRDAPSNPIDIQDGQTGVLMVLPPAQTDTSIKRDQMLIIRSLHLDPTTCADVSFSSSKTVFQFPHYLLQHARSLAQMSGTAFHVRRVSTRDATRAASSPQRRSARGSAAALAPVPVLPQSEEAGAVALPEAEEVGGHGLRGRASVRTGRGLEEARSFDVAGWAMWSVSRTSAGVGDEAGELVLVTRLGDAGDLGGEGLELIAGSRSYAVTWDQQDRSVMGGRSGGIGEERGKTRGLTP